MTVKLDKRGMARVQQLIEGGTPADARTEAKLLRKHAPIQLGDRQGDALRDAELLEAWAAREETRSKELDAILDEVRKPASDAPASKAKGTKPKAGKAKAPRKSPTKPKGPVGKAVSDALTTEPQQRIASSVRTGGGLLWTWLFLVFGVTLLAVAARRPDRLEAAFTTATGAVTGFINPWQGATTVPTANTTTNNTARLIRV